MIFLFHDHYSSAIQQIQDSPCTNCSDDGWIYRSFCDGSKTHTSQFVEVHENPHSACKKVLGIWEYPEVNPSLQRQRSSKIRHKAYMTDRSSQLK